MCFNGNKLRPRHSSAFERTKSARGTPFVCVCVLFLAVSLQCDSLAYGHIGLITRIWDPFWFPCSLQKKNSLDSTNFMQITCTFYWRCRRLCATIQYRSQLYNEHVCNTIVRSVFYRRQAGPISTVRGVFRFWRSPICAYNCALCLADLNSLRCVFLVMFTLVRFAECLC